MTSKILVVSDDLNATAEILRREHASGEDWTYYRCRKCGVQDSVCGHFEDTVEAAEIHVERCA
jgi:hypothetical protein